MPVPPIRPGLPLVDGAAILSEMVALADSATCESWLSSGPDIYECQARGDHTWHADRTAGCAAVRWSW